MGKMKLEGPLEGGVFVLHMGNDENVITFQFIEEFREHLKRVESNIGPTALVVTGEGKFFSNGLKLEVLMSSPKELLSSFQTFVGHLMTFPVPTVAAVNGHAFAGGAAICFGCDYRVMNCKRGYICVNEMDIGLPLSPGLFASFRVRARRDVWVKMMLGAKKWSGNEALSNGLVDSICEPEQVLKNAIQMASTVARMGDNKRVYGSTKREIYAEEVEMLKHLGEAAEYADTMLKSML